MIKIYIMFFLMLHTLCFGQTENENLKKSFSAIAKISMSDEEYKLYSEIIFYKNNSNQLVGAFADIKNGRKIIDINNGLEVRIYYLARAISIVNQSHNKINPIFLGGYIRYLAFLDNFNKYLTPDDYLKNFGIDFKLTANDNILIDNNSRKIADSMLIYVVFHELAHHMLNHLMNYNVGDVEKEVQADNFAFKKMLLAGIDPSFASFVMILFYEFGDRSMKNNLNSSHPSPINRINALFKEAELFYMASGKLHELDVSRNFYSLIKKIYYDKTSLDNDHVKKMADSGNVYYQQMTTRLYLEKYNQVGPSAELCEKLTRSLILSINNMEGYSHFDRIYSKYALGWTFLITEGCPHDELVGCEQMKFAAEQEYIPAIFELKYLRDQNRCLGDK